MRKTFMKSNEKGITLLALVITIIVLIIISGIVIHMSISDNGIVSKAKNTMSQVSGEKTTQECSQENIYQQITATKNTETGTTETTKTDISKNMGEFNLNLAVSVNNSTNQITATSSVTGNNTNISSYNFSIKKSHESMNTYKQMTQETTTSNRATATVDANYQYTIRVIAKNSSGKMKTASKEVLVGKLTTGTLAMKLENSSGETYTNNKWTNKNVYVSLATTGSAGTTTYESLTGSAQTVAETSDAVTISEEGTTTLRVKTVFRENVLYSDNYIIKIDKKAPVGTIHSADTINPTSTGATGKYQEYTISATGIYKISAYGAAGSNGSTGTTGTTGTSTGGKGALVYGEFNLAEGDKLIMLVGQKGAISGTASSTSDLTSGGGGGGTFITVVDGTSSNIISAKSNEKVKLLLAAAGGNGGNDVEYQNSIKNGADGIWTNGTSNTGFTKFLSSPNGISYTRSGLTGTGGYGGGTGVDDANGVGGGYQLGTTGNTAAYSYISTEASNKGGESGNNSNDGKIIIEKINDYMSTNVNGKIITYNLGIKDDISGVDLTNSKYIIDTNSSLKGTSINNWTGATSLTSENVSGTYTANADGKYYIHFLATDKTGNAVEKIKQEIVDSDAPTLTIKSSGTNSYPDILTLTANDNVGVSYIELPNGNKITGNENTTLNSTYNVTKNGPIAFKVADIAGHIATINYTEENVINFTTEWTTTSANTVITVPLTGTVDTYIDYGDGTKVNVTSENPTHTYVSAGTYTMKVSGKCTTWAFNESTQNYLTGLKQWGCLENTSYAFGNWNNGCTKMKGTIPTPSTKSFENITSFNCIFSKCSSLTGNIPTTLFSNCPNVISFENAFGYCSGLTGSIPAGLFNNCPKVTYFDDTFEYCNNLTGNIPAGLFNNCPEVTLFNAVFYYCSNLTGNIPAGLFSNNTKVTCFTGAFNRCSGLTGSIPAGLFSNCLEADDFGFMFVLCNQLTGNIPETLFSNNTKAISFSDTFDSCSGLTGSIPAGLFSNCPEVKDFSYTFINASGLTGSIPANLFANNKKVISFMGTFNGNYDKRMQLTGNIPAGLFSNCPEVTDFSYAFSSCSNLTGNIPANLFANNTKVTSFNGTFDLDKNLLSSIPAGLFNNCPEVTDFSYTFAGSEDALTQIPNGLFDNCTKVTSFKCTFNAAGITAIPSNLFDKCTEVKDFSSIFSYCNRLTSIPSGLFDKCTKVENFGGAFYCCTALRSIPSGLFDKCTSVTSFSTSEKINNVMVPDFGTFYGCTALTGTAPELWTRTNVTSSSKCFYNCTGLSNYSSIPSTWK